MLRAINRPMFLSEKFIYFFGDGRADGNAGMKKILGGKGANLAEMTNLDIPVPPGFTITTEVCDAYYKNNKQYPKGLAEEIEQNLSRLEKLMGAKLGDPNNPLLVSVRSGAAASMPGMMDTVLNLGLTPDAVNGLIEKTGNERFVWDAYRRFITMFGDVVMGVERYCFEEVLDKYKKKARIKNDTELTTDQLKKIVEKHFKDVQDIEFTIQEEQLYILQTRNGKRTTQAALKIAVDMVKEGLIDKKTAISRINPDELDQLLHPTFDPKAKKDVIAVGLPASPGAATGKVVFSAEDAEKLAALGQ